MRASVRLAQRSYACWKEARIYDYARRFCAPSLAGYCAFEIYKTSLSTSPPQISNFSTAGVVVLVASSLVTCFSAYPLHHNSHFETKGILFIWEVWLNSIAHKEWATAKFCVVDRTNIIWLSWTSRTSLGGCSFQEDLPSTYKWTGAWTTTTSTLEKPRSMSHSQRDSRHCNGELGTVHVPVLIIGGGPTGLFQALLLSQLGGS